MKVRYSQLFTVFLKIGALTIGGGYAMLPLIEREIVQRRAWLSVEDFADVLAVSQSLPGVLAVNMATSVGYRLRGLAGAIVAALGNVLLPILFILLLALFFRSFRGNRVVDALFLGLRPAVVALIAAPVFTIARSLKISWRNAWIPLLSALLVSLFNVNPVLVILLAALGGLLYGRLTKGRL